MGGSVVGLRGVARVSGSAGAIGAGREGRPLLATPLEGRSALPDHPEGICAKGKRKAARWAWGSGLGWRLIGRVGRTAGVAIPEADGRYRGCGLPMPPFREGAGLWCGGFRSVVSKAVCHPALSLRERGGVRSWPGAVGSAQASSWIQTGTWSEGLSRPRTALSMPVSLKRSAAWGDNRRWSMRMPLLRSQAPRWKSQKV